MMGSRVRRTFSAIAEADLPFDAIDTWCTWFGRGRQAVDAPADRPKRYCRFSSAAALPAWVIMK